MEGTGRTCLECQAPLGASARFCPECGQPTGFAVPGAPVPGGQAPGSPAPGRPAPPGPGFAAGPGFTAATPPSAAPPAADWGSPAAPGLGGPAGEDRADRTLTQAPSRPYQPPVPPPAWPRDPLHVPPPGRGYPPPYGQPPGEPRGFESSRRYQPAGPAGGQPPSGPPPGPFPGPPRQPPRRHDRNRSGTPLALWVILLAVLLGGGATAAVLVTHPFSRPSPREAASGGTRPTASAGAGTTSASTAPATTPATSASAPAVTEQQAAASVATMLGQSVSDRAAINTAYNDVMSCDPAMASAPRVFAGAASSRQLLLARLAALPGRATLPPALLSDLTRAWQASAAADQAFSQWASGELQGCTPNDTSSAAYQATVTPDDNATRYKTAFVAQWNPVAAQYNLTQYQQDQL